jgi:hypothetical protein
MRSGAVQETCALLVLYEEGAVEFLLLIISVATGMGAINILDNMAGGSPSISSRTRHDKVAISGIEQP